MERKSRTIVQILISNQKTIPNNDDWRFGKRNLDTLKICKIKSQANREPSFDFVLNRRDKRKTDVIIDRNINYNHLFASELRTLFLTITMK